MDLGPPLDKILSIFAQFLKIFFSNFLKILSNFFQFFKIFPAFSSGPPPPQKKTWIHLWVEDVTLKYEGVLNFTKWLTISDTIYLGGQIFTVGR